MYIVSAALLVIAALGIVHHRIVSGLWWQWRDVHNHETISLGLVGLALGIAIGAWLGG